MAMRSFSIYDILRVMPYNFAIFPHEWWEQTFLIEDNQFRVEEEPGQGLGCDILLLGLIDWVPG